MPTCRICGASAEYRPRLMFAALCDDCDRTTPDKLNRTEFERIYWNGLAETVVLSIRREFYDDYFSSNLTLEEYIRQTLSTFQSYTINRHAD